MNIERLLERVAGLFRRPTPDLPMTEFEAMRDALKPDKVRPLPQPVVSAYKVQKRR